MTDNSQQTIQAAIAWCLTWDLNRDSSVAYQQLQAGIESPSCRNDQLGSSINAVQQLFTLSCPKTLTELHQLISDHPLLWNQKIGLVYGGATKIKQYVFEATKLQEIRGASALLDRINIKDLRAFFDPGSNHPARSWLRQENAVLANALIPELIIYSTGGNILAFCPAPLVNDLANAIEKRYTHETLTANSCAVGATFKPLEIRFGLLPDTIPENLFWFEQYQNAYQDPEKRKFISAYIQPEAIEATRSANPNEDQLWQAFCIRKSFNELTSKLAVLFSQRRSGNDTVDRPSRRYPPMLETHPYLRRDGSEKRLAVLHAQELPSEPWLSEVTAAKYRIGQIAKRDDTSERWYRQANLRPLVHDGIESWVNKFERTLERRHSYYRNVPQGTRITEARSLREIGNACRGYVAYLYADGNNMGGYIQNIRTPQAYQKFSQDIFTATEQSVYTALATHLEPHQLSNLTDPDNQNRNGDWIHPFEIITIGGDDVMLIVPADKALAIARTLSEEFEKLLAEMPEYQIQGHDTLSSIHRYRPIQATRSQSKLSMSVGVLITAEDTPIYYAEDLTEQLLKSAKDRAKALKQYGYYGGTIDFLVLKAVTMISSNIKEFRKEGLVKQYTTRSPDDEEHEQTLKLYAAPYTLHEMSGILDAVNALKAAEFPKSQLYQLRSLLDRGKRSAMLNYRYFRVRLKQGQSALMDAFEQGWCNAHTNNGNLAPWMYDEENSAYETILRDLVDLYDFIDETAVSKETHQSTMEVNS